ncbi:hydroxymethylglutaryl-CoA lyase [Sphingobacteriales bacterium TSM_CSS]|nr:hydroxymethylglutaryl-CoA lyase [Sphingobacteriales bacterium TSM_CSS]
MKIIECPRDAMQGLHRFIDTDVKIAYINTLLQVGFDTIDFGSFVSPKVIPQMADTWKVVSRLDLSETDTKLLAIVANLRGAEEAAGFEQISYLGFPFSVSNTFQQRNTNASQAQAFDMVQDMYELCLKKGRELVIYLSMGFGNPYGDVWDIAILEHWIDRFVTMGVDIISISDTVGVATPEQIAEIFRNVSYYFPAVEFGAHLHTELHNWLPKIDAAFRNGCKRFDGALKGFGGCPMAQSKLVGNMPTEYLVEYFKEERADFFINETAFELAKLLADSIFEGSEATPAPEINI